MNGVKLVQKRTAQIIIVAVSQILFSSPLFMQSDDGKQCNVNVTIYACILCFIHSIANHLKLKTSMWMESINVLIRCCRNCLKIAALIGLHKQFSG